MITIANANALHIPLPDESVQCVVTSPPYWNLRDYGTAKWEGGSEECDHKQTTARHDAGRVNTNGFHGSAAEDSDKGEMNYRDICPRCGARRIDAQIGLESTPAEYVAHIVAVMRECWRVLKDDGTLWLNLGDSYNNAAWGNSKTDFQDPKRGAVSGEYSGGVQSRNRNIKTDGLKPKDLCGIPWRVAFALQDDGWYLRSDIIWHKPNPMPESVTDRPTKSHEYVFLLTKQARYYYDNEAIREPISDVTITKGGYDQSGNSAWPENRTVTPDDLLIDHFTGNMKPGKRISINPSGRNRRSVWTIATSPYSGAHFATFPPALIEPMILAGTSARGECPHCGKAWVREVEKEYENYRPNSRISGKQFPSESGAGHTNGQGASTLTNHIKSTTTGWRPQCTCRDMAICTADHSRDCLLCNNTGFVPMIPEPIPQTVLDPFAGSGTTGQVAVKHGRRAVLLDLNTKYIDLQFERTNGVQVTMPL